MASLFDRSFVSAVSIVVVVFAGACRQPQPEPIEKGEGKTSSASTSATPPKNEPKAPSGHPTAAMSAGTGSGSGATAGPEDLAWDAPASWVSAPNPNPMRKATYKIPKAAGETEDAELTVSVAAGGVEANVKRWEDQFGSAKAKTEPRTVNGLKVTVVELKGKFAGGGMMGQPSTPKDNQMLLGAVVDAGERQHFFKLVGGEKTVSAARKDFDKFVSSFRAK